MIWNDLRLRTWAAAGGVTPYDARMINPASIDLCWSGQYKVVSRIFDDKRIGWSSKVDWSATMTVECLLLEPNKLYLLDSIEYVRIPTNASGMLALKSSIGRRGIEHLHAGFFDPGFHGTCTWEIVSMWPVANMITKGDRLMQMVMSECEVPDKDYTKTGRYAGQKEPTGNLPERNT